MFPQYETRQEKKTDLNAVFCLWEQLWHKHNEYVIEGYKYTYVSVFRTHSPTLTNCTGFVFFIFQLNGLNKSEIPQRVSIETGHISHTMQLQKRYGEILTGLHGEHHQLKTPPHQQIAHVLDVLFSSQLDSVGLKFLNECLFKQGIFPIQRSCREDMG